MYIIFENIKFYNINKNLRVCIQVYLCNIISSELSKLEYEFSYFSIFML